MATLMTRLQNRASDRSWYRIENKTAEQPTKVYVYDEIGWLGVTAADFVRDLDALDADAFDLHVNSPGGDAFDGMAIRNAIQKHKATVTTYVDGLAASAASYIALAGDEVVMSAGSQLMIHDAAGLAIGNSKTMRDMGDVLDKISDSIAGFYAAKAGGTVNDWRKTMRAETWYTAQEAVDAGLADRIDGETDDKVENKFDLSIFNYAGRSKAPAPTLPAADSAPADHPNPKGADMTSDKFLSGLRDRLGVKAELDEDGLLAALDEALAEQPDPKPAPLPDGVVAVDKLMLDDLKAAAEQGREAHARQQADDRARVVDSAISDGRIAPSRRDAWIKNLAADPGAVEVLNGLEPNTIPVVALGHTGGVEEASDDDRIYASLFGQEA